MLRRRHRRFILAGTIILLLVVSGSLFMVSFFSRRPIENQEQTLPIRFDEDLLSLDGYVPVKIGVAPSTVYLVSNCTGLVLQTSLGKSYTIQRGLEKTLEARPDSYDLIFDLMSGYEIGVKQVRIKDIKQGIYYAELIVERDGSILSLDAKPTDVLAVATRFKVPIYVNQELLRSYGQKVC